MYWTESAEFRKWLPKLQAHRGYWVKGLPQNSLASIQKAFEIGYEIVEFDVRLTADNQAVLFHDEAIDGIFIHDMTFNQLNLRTPVNTLGELMQWFETQPKNLKLNIELKTKYVFDGRLEDEVIKILNQYSLANQIMITSFNPFTLGRIRTRKPDIYRGLILTLEEFPLNRWFIKERFFNFLASPHALHLRFNDWNAKKFKKISSKVPVVLWTVNDVQYLSKVNSEVHGVISDEITPPLNQTKI